MWSSYLPSSVFWITNLSQLWLFMSSQNHRPPEKVTHSAMKPNGNGMNEYVNFCLFFSLSFREYHLFKVGVPLDMRFLVREKKTIQPNQARKQENLLCILVLAFYCFMVLTCDLSYASLFYHKVNTIIVFFSPSTSLYLSLFVEKAWVRNFKQQKQKHESTTLDYIIIIISCSDAVTHAAVLGMCFCHVSGWVWRNYYKWSFFCYTNKVIYIHVFFSCVLFALIYLVIKIRRDQVR